MTRSSEKTYLLSGDGKACAADFLRNLFPGNAITRSQPAAQLMQVKHFCCGVIPKRKVA